MIRSAFWKVLLTGGAAPAMRSEFLRVAGDMSKARPINPRVPLELATAFTVSGIFEILGWWLKQPDDYPVANVVTLFDALIIDSIGRPRKVSLTNIVRPAVAAAHPDSKPASKLEKKPAKVRKATAAAPLG